MVLIWCWYGVGMVLELSLYALCLALILFWYGVGVALAWFGGGTVLVEVFVTFWTVLSHELRSFSGSFQKTCGRESEESLGCQ